jgi:hypothetical protein
MDQPFSRPADALLDKQYWSPEDPQKHPYDDTGWSFGDLFNAKVVRVTDDAILSAQMEKIADPSKILPPAPGPGSAYIIDNTGQIGLASLVYALKAANVSVAEAAFDNGGHHFSAGSLVVNGPGTEPLTSAAQRFALKAYPLSSALTVRTHPAAAPRIAFLHSWLFTQTEGWWRLAFDDLHVPYAYISTQRAAAEPNLRAKYDVIIFAPVGNTSPAQIVSGLPMWGNALPWQKTESTPNLGRIDSTTDMRPGLGFEGVANLKKFVEEGGLLITCEDTAELAIEEGLAPGVFAVPHSDLKVVGSVLKAVTVDNKSPVAYGYDGTLAVYSKDGMAFTVGNMTVNRPVPTEKEYKRPTGRGGPEDADEPEGRPVQKPEPLPSPKPWQAAPLNEEQSRNNPYVIPEDLRPDVIMRFSEKKDLLISGLLEGGSTISERPIVVDAHLGKGNVLLFANNPVYRGETIGSYGLVFNAILNYEHLNRAEMPSGQ